MYAYFDIEADVRIHFRDGNKVIIENFGTNLTEISIRWDNNWVVHPLKHGEYVHTSIPNGSSVRAFIPATA